MNLYVSLMRVQQSIIIQIKMNTIDEKIEQFFYTKFPFPAYSQTILSTHNYQLPLKQEKLKNYRNQSLTHPKSIKDFSFMKKYCLICQYLLYVSNWRPVPLQNIAMLEIIKRVYDSYELFIQWGWWKQENHQTFLQQFLLMILDCTYPTFIPVDKKSAINTFDKYLLAFFFTLNLQKTGSKLIKNFINFLNESYPPSYFFLYISLRSQSQILADNSIINSQFFTKIIQILQSDSRYSNSINQSPLLSNFNSLATQRDQKSLTTEWVQPQHFDVDLEVFFETPISECFVIPKVQMYRILTICGLIVPKEEKDSTLKWEQFLKMYFGQGDGIDCQVTSYEHLISIGLAKATFQLGQKLIEDEDSRRKFLEQAFTYVFQILELIFQEQQPQIQDISTKQSIRSLRKTYKSMKSLNNYGITVMNRFGKRILKNNYILSLYKEYC